MSSDPRLSAEKAKEIAQGAAAAAGMDWEEPIGCGFSVSDSGRGLWLVITNADSRGGHVRVQVSDATGEIVEIRTLPR